MADDALALIQQHVDRYQPADFFPSQAERDALLVFLKPQQGLYARLSEMHDRGLLGRLFPEFQRIESESFATSTTSTRWTSTPCSRSGISSGWRPGRRHSAVVFGISSEDLDAPELLVLALLFHDVGKWGEGNHAVESVEDGAADVPIACRCRRTATALVEFLIAHHLHMSRVAFRRDTDDPIVVGQLADLVGTEERLKMLCLLTLVDIEAVSLETLTPWHEELLWRLFVAAYNHLTLISRRRAHRIRSGRRDRAVRRPAAGPVAGGTDAIPGRITSPVPYRCSIMTPSTGTCAWRATSNPITYTRRSNESTGCGS